MNAILNPRTPAVIPDKERIDGRVTVSCTARLHLGFFDLDGGLGRRFGSIGLSLDQPVTRLVARRSSSTRISGPEHERVARYLTLMCAHLGVPAQHEIEVHQVMPAHAGLGSGTQLALAVATAVRLLHGRTEDPRTDAARLGRGARSGIGIGLFGQGGLVVDGGQRDVPGDDNGSPAGPPPLLVRAAVPEAWRVLLVLDRDREGLFGSRERAAFGALAPMDAAVSGAICRLVLMQALPALAEQDFSQFGAAISSIQECVGDYFAPCQGGRFTSPDVGIALGLLAQTGATGIGQSSWGPTGFAFAASENEARRLVRVLEESGVTKRLDLLICRVLNRGASVTEENGPEQTRPDEKGA
jgi:beta-ribofuranosylaminobenzene 5'-phosphate synthase